MATANILQRLYSLNSSSPHFCRNLHDLIQSDGEDHYLSGLQGSDLIRLVDFLDEVRVLPFALSSLWNRLYRPSPSSRPRTMFPDCVCSSCGPFVATAGSYHLRTLFLVASPSLAITQWPLETLVKYGKGNTIAPRCVSNVRGSPCE